MRLKVECTNCHGTIEVEVQPKDYNKWILGEHIQKVMPYLSPGQRELLISHICEPCFDNLFSEEKDDNIN